MLILGGTGDAAQLAQRCVLELADLRTISSLAGRTHTPAPVAGETHTGGFGGAQGLSDFLRQQHIGLVVDATHPYATLISRNAARACTALGIPRLQLLRHAWHPHGADRWIDAHDAADAALKLAAEFDTGELRVFLSTGRQQLQAFAHLHNTWFLLRTVDPLASPAPLRRCTNIFGRGPFSVADEGSLLEQHKIDVVVSKNSGTDATYAKIVAARALSLPVIMLQRPAPPAGAAVHSIDEVITWIQSTR